MDCIGVKYTTAYINTDSVKIFTNKSMYDMKDSIQIDDMLECLYSTNAEIKILFDPKFKFDSSEIEPNTEIYITRSWKEILDIVRWYYDGN